MLYCNKVDISEILMLIRHANPRSVLFDTIGYIKVRI